MQGEGLEGGEVKDNAKELAELLKHLDATARRLVLVAARKLREGNPVAARYCIDLAKKRMKR